jgi:7-cyano-7-deazaguanine tRNA-ribosyltransferase
MGPIQGGKYLDLLRNSARRMRRLRFDLYALGSPTEVMESYQFPLLAQMIHAAKTELPLSKPLHLFGAGHPLTLPLAVALGCDTFDSASYALYAREGRYLTGSGTQRIEELTYLPCVCPICQATTVQELRSGEESPKQLARHNLWVLRHEMLAVKQAIREGRLWEYLGVKARCHPKLWEAYQLLEKFHTLLDDGTPAFKDRSPFLFNPIDAQRPEVSRARRRIAENLRIDSAVHVVLPEQEEKPYSRSILYGELVARLGNLGKQVQISFLLPAFGPIPAEVSDVYPFPQCLYPAGFDENREVERLTLKQATKMLGRSGRILIVDGFPRHVRLMGKLQKRLPGSLLARLASTPSVGDAADRVAEHVMKILKDTEAVPP